LLILLTLHLAETSMRKHLPAFLAVISLGSLLTGLGGCENMSPGQRGAVTGGALGTGVGMVAGGSFGQVVGAGLIGGALGYVVGENTK
jgi:hypothetical protein